MPLVLYDNPASPTAMEVRFLLGEALALARPRLDVRERFLADNGTVVRRLTIADCAFAPVLRRWYRLPLSFDPWPKVARLRETVTARTAFGEIGLVA
jgi:glutathione S-transferase